MAELPPVVRLALGVVSSAAGAAVFYALSLPLPFILGSMLGSALFVNLIGPVGQTRYVRRAGQLILGSSVASILSVATIYDLLSLVPLMVATALAANLVSVGLAFPLARLAGVDRLSALLAALPAGMSEMASLAAELKARSEFVTVCHTLRVVLVVFTVPFLVGMDTSDVPAQTHPGGGSYEALALCFVLGVVLSYLADRANVLNPWVIFPMAVGVVIVLFGYELAPMPAPLLTGAQIAIGFSLGARLKRDDLARLPRATAAGLLANVMLIASMMLGAIYVLEPLTGMHFPTLALSLAPGGLGEMIATAKALGLASASVASFQFVRSFLTNILAPPLILLLVRGRSGGG